MIRKKIDLHIILLACLVLIMGAVIFYRIIVKKYFYLSLAGDSFHQYVHFFNLFHDLVRSGELPFWSWNYGPGGSFWNDFGYYMLGDIFIWPLLLFPKGWFPFSFIPITILKLFLISLGTYLFLKKLSVKKGIALLAGIANSFALFNFDHFFTHYFFLNAAVYFPFILLGYERYISNQKPILLFITLFLASISNFYFLFMITIGLFFYSIFRYFSGSFSDKNLKGFFLFHLKLSCLFLLSLGTAMVIFLPSVISLFHSSLFHRPHQPILDKFLSIDDLIRKLIWNGGINFIPFLMIPLFFINKIKYFLIYGIMGLTLLLMISLQDVNSFVGGLSNPFEFRAFFLFNTLFIMLSSIAVDKIDFKRWKNICVILIISCLIYYWIDTNPFTHYAKYIKFIPIAFSIFFIISQFIHNSWIKKVIISLTGLTVIAYSLILPYSFVTDLLYKSGGGNPGPYHKGIWGVLPLINKNKYEKFFDNYEVKKTLNYVKTDKDFFRMTVNSPGIIGNNSSMSYGYKSYTTYQSLVNWNLQNFEMDYLGQDGFRRLNRTRGFQNNTFITTILNNKYNISFNGSKTKLFGYKEIYKHGNTIIEKNENSLPIGFLYNSAVSSSLFNQTDYQKRDELILRNAVVPESVYNNSGLSSDLKSSVKTIGTLSQAKYDKVSKKRKVKNGLLVYSTRPIEITIPVKNHPLSELRVYADIIPYTKNQGITINTLTNLGGKYFFEKNMNHNQYQISQYHYTDTTNKVLFRFGKDQKTQWVRLTIQPGKFLIKNIQVSTDDYKVYKDITSTYKRNSLKEIKFGNNYIQGKYSSNKEAILFLSIPFSSGWKATIDGKKVDTFPVHSAFMGIAAPQGNHAIKLTFTPEGFFPGLIISLISFSLTLFLFIIGRKTKRIG